MTIAEGQGQGL